MLPAGCRLVSPSSIETPIVVLTFDDQHLSVYEKAFPLMREFGYRGTNFVNSASIGNQGLMNWEQIREMELDHHWETGGHTLHHEQLNQLDLDEAEQNLNQDYQNLRLHGLRPRSFALPRGQCPEQVYPIILDLYQNIRGSSDFAMHSPIDRKALGYLAFQSGWTEEPVKHRILRGIMNNESIIIIGFHRFDADTNDYQDSCSSPVFRNILSFLQAQNLKVLPLHEAVEATLRN
ncbi:MAG: polysaccharide deacetylase family protein [Candidatus Cloacimonadaceae bacterium]|jgi:peptidoglycan/xylan/chitin deacetylase (PgdA/CDA1 family)|nr:polysaccharide deacetylase family protein [Candidatus Cloacimonadota bacterium]